MAMTEPETSRFERLLTVFRFAQDASAVSVKNECKRYERLLTSFRVADQRETEQELRSAQHNSATFDELLSRYRSGWHDWAKRQSLDAEVFNLLDVVGLVGHELCHSRVLSWLLDRDFTRFGTHCQGSLGFRLFLEEFGLPLSFADVPYHVRTEVPGQESRIDLEIAAPSHFVIHIENKIWSTEGIDQTVREWNDLQRRSAEIGISYDNSRKIGLFLTPDGARPLSINFRAITWRQVAHVFERIGQSSKSVDVQLFSLHYAKALRLGIINDFDEEKHNGETVIQ
jgi:hypothetical protein